MSQKERFWQVESSSCWWLTRPGAHTPVPCSVCCFLQHHSRGEGLNQLPFQRMSTGNGIRITLHGVSTCLLTNQSYRFRVTYSNTTGSFSYSYQNCFLCKHFISWPFLSWSVTSVSPNTSYHVHNTCRIFWIPLYGVISLPSPTTLTVSSMKGNSWAYFNCHTVESKPNIIQPWGIAWNEWMKTFLPHQGLSGCGNAVLGCCGNGRCITLNSS